MEEEDIIRKELNKNMNEEELRKNMQENKIRKGKIENLLKFCWHYRPDAESFLMSITRQYYIRGNLSEKQIMVLEKIAGEVQSNQSIANQSIEIVKRT